MSAGALGWLTLALVSGALPPAVAAWRLSRPAVCTLTSIALLGLATAVAGLPADVALTWHPAHALLVTCGGALAVFGGGPVTTLAFRLVERGSPTTSAPQIGTAGSVLRGGAWIGALERAAIYASLASGLNSGVAVILALKALGRYPELRNRDVEGIAERFIIGTFVSLLYAVACAGVVHLVR